MEAVNTNTTEVLQNLQKFFNDISEDKETKALVNGYIKTKDINKQKQIINYLAEKYNIDENIVNQYFSSLREKAEQKLKEIDELDKINEKLFKNLQYKSNVKFSTLHILMPFLLLKNVAETYSVAGEIWANQFKQLALKHINNITLKNETDTYLKKIKKLLNDGKYEELEKESLKELTLLPEEEQTLLIENLKETKNEIDAEIKEEAGEQVLLLTHKVTDKDVNLSELESFENVVAENLYNHGNNINSKFLSATELLLNNNLKYNLLKQVFTNLTPEEFAKMLTYAHAHANSDISKDLFTMAEKGELSEAVFNKEISSILKDPEYKELFNDIKKELYGLDISEIKPKKERGLQR
ncbi:hypothetical protein NAMH_1499 [Nautilia profundicola AmH]|uniref:Uncharacterized protein n=1 Tax=Nautilia profundicola (strain ATCC BAA-1463 / DSM 18972 / AmH) TaxID=598659 RepID=B9L6A1_NAUPA|nr:hypothetical protein [Nautilia profundicola]ACM92336.1 hypothetical protein NAMH_1499 [Nautilia profundicola AmH]